MGPSQTPLVLRDEVFVRLEFAARRLDDLLKLNGGYLPGANVHERLQLSMSFLNGLMSRPGTVSQALNEVDAGNIRESLSSSIVKTNERSRRHSSPDRDLRGEPKILLAIEQTLVNGSD